MSGEHRQTNTLNRHTPAVPQRPSVMPHKKAGGLAILSRERALWLIESWACCTAQHDKNILLGTHVAMMCQRTHSVLECCQVLHRLEACEKCRFLGLTPDLKAGTGPRVSSVGHQFLPTYRSQRVPVSLSFLSSNVCVGTSGQL